MDRFHGTGSLYDPDTASCASVFVITTPRSDLGSRKSLSRSLAVAVIIAGSRARARLRHGVRVAACAGRNTGAVGRQSLRCLRRATLAT